MNIPAAPTPEPAPGATEGQPPAPGQQPAAASEPRPGNDLGLLYDTDDAAAQDHAAGEQVHDDSGEGGEEPAAAAGEQPDAETIATVDELIEANQFDPDWFQNLKLNVKVDRQTTAVSLADLVKSYQIGAASDKRLEDAKIQAKAITQAAAEKSQTVEAELAAVGALITHAEELLDQDLKSVNLERLRTSDPAEYAAQRSDLKDRKASIEALKDKAKQGWRDHFNRQQQDNLTKLRTAVQEQSGLLLDTIPEWSEPETAKREKADIKNYLVHEWNFSPDEVATVFDHRYIAIARLAMKQWRLEKKTEPAKKRVEKVPKVIKPGPQQAVQSRPKNSSMVDDLYPKR